MNDRLCADHVYFAVQLIKLNLTITQCEKGVIPSDANIFARVEACSTLPYDDVTRDDCFSAILFDAEHLRVAVSSVFGSSLSFFVCHGKLCGLDLCRMC
jgi:hypothetical protein